MCPAIISAADPAAAAGKIERWLRFAPGDVYHLPGRGPGRIVEMNPALDVLRFEVGGVKLPLSLVSAERSLQPPQVETALRQISEKWPENALSLETIVQEFPLGAAPLLHLLAISSICTDRTGPSRPGLVA